MHTVGLWKSWSTLTDAVRAGASVIKPGVEGHDERWTQAFIAAMHRNAQTTAAEVVRLVGPAAGRMLDIGGGSGAYSIAFVQANPALRAEIFDLPQVTPIAARHIVEAGLADRIATRNGDLRSDEFGGGYDLILLSAICHMLGPEENQDLFRRCARALSPGGRLMIRDFILEPDKTAPKAAAMFALNMLVGTRSGATYTAAEYGVWLHAAGLTRVERPNPDADVLIARW
jgi:predicted O-methyltransferase YrrM